MKRISLFFLITFFGYSGLYAQDYPDEFYNSEKHVINSEILNSERLLFIYLPNDYYENTSQSYPVHYLTDAPLSSNIYFDLSRLHSLLNDAPQCIVVGLSSDDRDYNQHPQKGASRYQEFIKKEVIPFVEKAYRTQPFRVLAGHSLGGDFVIYSMLKEADLFDAYIAGSPGPQDVILTLLDYEDFNFSKEKYRFFYTSVGSEDFSDTLTFKKIEEKMKAKMGKNVDSYFIIHHGEGHISNLPIGYQEGLMTLYRNWKYKLPEKLDKPVSEDIKEHYDKLEAKFGYRPVPGEWTIIFPVMDQLARQGDFKNAIDILKYDLTLYPESDQAYAFLAMAHFDTGKIEEGNQYLKKALELNPENPFALGMEERLEND
ncbi:MAG: alpha/beta hydrolase-fold protein [Bacteroidales bacterium]